MAEKRGKTRKKNPPFRWREKHLEGLMIKTAYIVCEGHGVYKNGRKRRRAHIDVLRLSFTNGATLEMTAELPTWGFVGAPSSSESS